MATDMCDLSLSRTTGLYLRVCTPSVGTPPHKQLATPMQSLSPCLAAAHCSQPQSGAVALDVAASALTPARRT